MELISVIIPVYNAELYLDRCLHSVQRQQHKQLEIIIINDGSTDRSADIIRKHALADQRIKVYTNRQNIGTGSARNLGMHYSTANYFTFLDADDFIDNDYISTLYNEMQDSGADIIQCGYRRVTDKGKIISTKLPLHFYQFTSACMRLYRKEAIMGIAFPNSIYYEDIAFSLDIWLRHPDYQLLAYRGYNYTLNQQSKTSKIKPENKQEILQLLNSRTIYATWTEKLLIYFTILRLKLHFLFNK